MLYILPTVFIVDSWNIKQNIKYQISKLSTDWFIPDRNRLAAKYRRNRNIILLQISNKLAVMKWTFSN